MNYNVSHSHPSDEMFNTAYMVTDKNGVPYKIYKLSNNIKKKEVNLLVLDGKSGEEDEGYAIPYSPYAGLVITPDRDSIVYLAKPYQDLYVISFDDESKHDVTLNFLTVGTDYSILFSAIPDSLFKKNKAMLQELALYKVTLQKQEEERKEEEKAKIEEEKKQRIIDSLVRIGVEKALADVKHEQQIAAQHVSDSVALIKAEEEKQLPVILGLDSLCRQFITDSMRAEKIHESINAELRLHKDADYEYDIDEERKYTGDKKNGKWEGNGLMIIDNSIFKGVFIRNQFFKGIANVKLPDRSKYIGEFERDKPQGFGQLIYPNGDIAIGYFVDGNFSQGITHKKDKESNYYYGYIKDGKKNGFGIYVSSASNFYIGIFNNDKFMSGYIAINDASGLKNYFEVKDYVKTSIDGNAWNKFSTEYAKLKTTYHM